jgi:hypothetical protein
LESKGKALTLKFKVLLNMKEQDVYEELSSIRSLMERSSRFISLSGLSGILVGLYALAGARMGIRMVTNHYEIGSPPDNVPVIANAMAIVALMVLTLSIVTSLWLTIRKARRRNEQVWNPVSRRLLVASGIPFITGGLVMFILFLNGQYTYIASMSLLFYGLALIAASQFTFNEVRWLGIVQLSLGLIALQVPQHSLIIWAIGFGLLHILYGTYMHFKYER